MEDDELLTVAEVAQRLKLSPETVRRWLRSGRLEGVIFSDAAGYRIRASEVARLVAGSPKTAERRGEEAAVAA